MPGGVENYRAPPCSGSVCRETTRYENNREDGVIGENTGGLVRRVPRARGSE